MKTIHNEISNFNFTNFTPAEGIKKKCIQMCRRIKVDNKNIKSSFFIEKHVNIYKAVGILTVESKIFVFSSSSVNLLTTLLMVESGLRKQLDLRYNNKVYYRDAV